MTMAILPVIVPFFQSLGLSMAQVFQLQAIFGIGILLLEIPTGYVADLFGRKKALILGAFFAGVGFTYLIFIHSFVELIIYELILSLAFSFISGSDISLIYDSYRSDERQLAARGLANLQMAMVLGEASSSILGGFLVMWSFKYVLWATAITMWLPFFISLTLKETQTEVMNRHTHWQNFKEMFIYVFRSGDDVLRLTFINMVLWSLATYFSVWIYQKYWEVQGVELRYFGILWAIHSLLVGVIGKFIHSWEQKLGATTLLWCLAVCAFLGYFGMGIASGFIGVAFALFFPVIRGITQVLLRDALNWRIPAKFRSTVNSAQSFCFRLGFALFGPLVGYGLDHGGMRTTLVVLGLVFGVLAILVLRPLIKKVP